MIVLCHNINPIHGPYIDSPDWIKNKKATISINIITQKDNKSFQYAAIVALKGL